MITNIFLFRFNRIWMMTRNPAFCNLIFRPPCLTFSKLIVQQDAFINYQFSHSVKAAQYCTIQEFPNSFTVMVITLHTLAFILNKIGVISADINHIKRADMLFIKQNWIWSLLRTFKWDTMHFSSSRGCKTAGDQS